jgi:COP9 signalosome complex subunit 6
MYGALLASQSGRDIDIINSFDLPLSIDGKDQVVLDITFLSYKLDQCK